MILTLKKGKKGRGKVSRFPVPSDLKERRGRRVPELGWAKARAATEMVEHARNEDPRALVKGGKQRSRHSLQGKLVTLKGSYKVLLPDQERDGLEKKVL